MHATVEQLQLEYTQTQTHTVRFSVFLVRLWHTYWFLLRLWHTYWFLFRDCAWLWGTKSVFVPLWTLLIDCIQNVTYMVVSLVRKRIFHLRYSAEWFYHLTKPAETGGITMYMYTAVTVIQPGLVWPNSPRQGFWYGSPVESGSLPVQIEPMCAFN